MSEPSRSVVFLHIPKTAGQSVHAFLKAGYPRQEVCPAREQWQLIGTPLPELRRYRLFSGHLDWLSLDFTADRRFIFTILREPLDRILSFYFFLRRTAQEIPREELHTPQRRGLRAALELTPDEYFCGGGAELRSFIDDHYDNFYTYYFAGRSFDARRRLRGRLGLPPRNLTEEGLVEVARANLSELSGVYRVEELERLEADVRPFLPSQPPGRLAEIRANVGTGTRESRLEQLAQVGPARQAMARIQQMCLLDEALWKDPGVFAAR